MTNDAKLILTPKLRFPEFREELWEEKKIGDFLEESRVKGSGGDIARKLTVKLWGKGVFGKIESLRGSENTQYYRRRAGQFIYSKLDFLNQAFGVIPNDLDGFESTVDLPCFDISEPLHPYFLLEYVKRPEFYEKFGGIADGGRKAKRIQADSFLSFPILVPAKFHEQQKIADCLSTLDKLIGAESQKLDAVKAHKKGLMQQLFPRKGETIPSLRFPEFQDAGEWKEKSFGKILKIASGKGFKASEYSKTGIRLLQIENVGYGATKWTENTIYLPETYATEYPELVLRGGDIVLALNRPVTNDELKIAKIQKHEAIAILYQRVGKLEILDDALRMDFVFHVCRQFIKDFVVDKSIGSDQPFISLKDLYSQNLHIPAPPEQQRIANCLSSLDELITAQGDRLEALKTHKNGLMQQLFPSPSESAG